MVGAVGGVHFRDVTMRGLILTAALYVVGAVLWLWEVVQCSISRLTSWRRWL